MEFRDLTPDEVKSVGQPDYKSVGSNIDLTDDSNFRTLDAPHNTVYDQDNDRTLALPQSLNSHETKFVIDRDVDEMKNFFGMEKISGPNGLPDLASADPRIGNAIAESKRAITPQEKSAASFLLGDLPQTALTAMKEFGENAANFDPEKNRQDNLIENRVAKYGLRGLLPENPISQIMDVYKWINKPAGAAIAAKADELLEQNKQYLAKNGFNADGLKGTDAFVYNLTNGLMSVGAGMGMSYLTGTPAAATFLFGAMQKAQTYAEAREIDPKTGQPKLSPEQASELSNSTGMLSAAIEMMGEHVVLQAVPGNTAFKKFINRGLTGAVTQGAEEGGQAAVDEVFSQSSGIRVKSREDTYKNIFTQAGFGIILGVPMNIVLGGVHEAGSEAGLNEKEISNIQNHVETQGHTVTENPAEFIDKQMSPLVHDDENYKHFVSLYQKFQNGQEIVDPASLDTKDRADFDKYVNLFDQYNSDIRNRPGMEAVRSAFYNQGIKAGLSEDQASTSALLMAHVAGTSAKNLGITPQEWLASKNLALQVEGKEAVNENAEPKNLDERLDEFNLEAKSLNEENVHGSLKSVLTRLGGALWGGSTNGEADSVSDALIAKENGRRDVAEAIADRDQRAADNTNTEPGVPSNHPKYEEIKQKLLASKAKSQENADRTRSIANSMKEQNDVHLEEAQNIHDFMQKSRNVRTLDRSNPAAVQRALKLPGKPESVLQFISRQGGISTKELTGELRLAFDGKDGRGIWRYLKDQGGVPLEKMYQKLVDAGYIDQTPYDENNANETDEQKVIDLITQENGGHKIYDRETQMALDDHESQLYGGVDYLNSMGIDESSSVDDIRQALADRDQIHAPFNEQSEEDEIPFLQDPAAYNSDGDVKTNSEAFKKWFGDSKVLDEDGKPLVVYHGSSDKVQEFNADVQRRKSSSGKFTGFHFGTNAQAVFRNSKQIIAVYLSAKNIKVLRDNGGGWDKEVQKAIKEGFDSISYLNRYEGIPKSEYELAEKRGVDTSVEALERMSDKLFKENFPSAEKSFIVFKPEQIKSVNNRGTFDANDPRILYQKDQSVIPGAEAISDKELAERKMQGRKGNGKAQQSVDDLDLFNEAKTKQQSLFQGDKARGSITFGKDRTLINLFKSSNASTLFHELTHLFLRDFRDVAARASNVRVKADWELIKKFLGAKGDTFTVKQEEKFARAGEQYYREGKAPTKELQGIFDKFKDWFGSIYKSAKDLNVEITPEIRGVFDRMLGGDYAEQETLNQRQANRDIENDYAANRALMKSKPGTLKADAIRVLKGSRELVGDLGVPISTRLSNIDKGIMHSVRRYIFDTGLHRHEDRLAIKDLVKGIDKNMSEDDYYDFDLALKNRDVDKVDFLIDKYGMQKEFAGWGKTRDELYSRAIDAGIDVGFVEDYFPRQVKRGMASEYVAAMQGNEAWSEIEFAMREVDPDNAFSDEEKASFINKYLRGFSSQAINLSKPGFAKERSVDYVEPEFNRFYDDSINALNDYINGMNLAIESAKLFGKSDKNLDNSIGSYVKGLIEDGTITHEQEKELKKLLKATVDPRGITNNFLAWSRDASYIYTMGSPISAITQIQDLAWSLHKNGYWRTGVSLAKSLTGNEVLKKEDIGIDNIIEEYADQTRASAAVRKIFKGIGLVLNDNIGKEVYVDATLSKFKSLNKKSDAGFNEYLDGILGKEADGVREELKDKNLSKENMSENLKYLLFSELSDVQPLSIIEQPVGYALGGDWRIAYMLKSYTIKQMDVFRREVFSDLGGIVPVTFKDGQLAWDKSEPKRTAKALKNLISLSSALVLLGFGKDALVDFLLGRDFDANEVFVNNVLQLFGANKYQIYKSKQDGIVRTLFNSWFFPAPAGIIDDNYRDFQKISDGKLAVKDAQLFGHVPLVGKFYYWWTGGGRTKEDKKSADAAKPHRKKKEKVSTP